jgi:ankyrin repeat protein
MSKVSRLLGRRPRNQVREACLYVHLRKDGGIFAVKGSGEQGLLTEMKLMSELKKTVASGGILLYSRDNPTAPPSTEVDRLFRSMVDLRPTLQLVKEAHPDAPGPPDGATTLMQSAYLGLHEVVEDLLRRGSPVNARDDSGYTALMYASQKGHASCLRVLLKGLADVNARDNDGNTPLMFAAQGGYLDAVDVLLAAGADRSLRGRAGFTAFAFARQNGHGSLLDRLDPAR